MESSTLNEPAPSGAARERLSGKKFWTFAARVATFLVIVMLGARVIYALFTPSEVIETCTPFTLNRVMIEGTFCQFERTNPLFTYTSDISMLAITHLYAAGAASTIWWILNFVFNRHRKCEDLSCTCVTTHADTRQKVETH